MTQHLLIQAVLVVAIVAASAVLLRGRGSRHLAVRRLLLLVFAALAVLSVVFPAAVTRAANVLGVGRGTDLLVYALIVAFVSYVATSYLRFRELETRFTKLARRLALDEAPPPERWRESAAPAGASAPGPRPSGPDRTAG